MARASLWAVATMVMVASMAWPAAAGKQAVVVVNVTGSASNMLIATRAVAGFMNRPPSTLAAAGPLVYTVGSAADQFWLGEVIVPDGGAITHMSPAAFLAQGLKTFAVLQYNSSAPELLPAVATMAGLLDAVPLDSALVAAHPTAKVVFNATGRWSSPQEAVRDAAAFGLNRTSSLCFQKSERLVDGILLDWIVSERLFTTYLPNLCLPWTADHAELKAIVDAAPWPTPTTVYGYNSQDPLFGGDLFEAETDCINTLGQVASDGATNMAFWARYARQGPALRQPADEPVTYNASKTYVALVYGDMDNLEFVQSFGAQHMLTRSERCAAAAKGNGTCFPLTWTLSPNLLISGPRMMRWYYTTSTRSQGLDHFCMPPSGWLYSYPGEMEPEVQARYVAQMQTTAVAMNTSASVEWEWLFTWGEAYKNYFPRYVQPASQPGVRTFLLNDVPWPVPILSMNTSYRVFTGTSGDEPVVIFKPAFNWCDGCGSGGLPYNATVIANKLSNLPPGSIEYVYIIQNTDVNDLFNMAAELAEHVELVSYGQLTDVALQHYHRTGGAANAVAAGPVRPPASRRGA